MKYTNNNNIPLPLAVWVLDDDYDYIDDPKYISATSLLKPTKELVLAKRITEEQSIDIEHLAASAYGTAVHSAIEKAWIKHYQSNLSKLGYSNEFIDKLRINPTEVDSTCIPIYIEQRKFKKFNDWIVGGKFDFCFNGQLCDNKSTSVYTWIKGDKDKDYSLQGSIYRWLCPEIITKDTIQINFIFTDWQKSKALIDKNYPPSRLMSKEIPLMSIAETEMFIAKKLKSIEDYTKLQQSDMEDCSDEDLWRDPPVFKYYKDATKTDGRSTKNFDSLEEAMQFKLAKGGNSVILERKGSPKKCIYCTAKSICNQRKKYFDDNDILIKEE